ncbi:Rieske [2Fe-2S] domain-containing protein [Calothrix sp. NIES-4071]|nr:Rieske [2Fe-2S] domain-containing protein [Calothrix sp. NIES-4071]BAZ61086.1 Rieske [2Fe-2S] domain-containing protein [Calothrix sp. NIES-4105]
MASHIISNQKTKIFNNSEYFIEGWYWAIPSYHLKIGQVKPVTLMGRDLAIYRRKNNQVTAVDAYCPHMGAHLAEGKVEGNALRCFFHNWKFDADGTCIEVPCINSALPVKINTWQTAEKYGMIWVWTGKHLPSPLPFVPELEDEECDSALAKKFIKNCHPNVVMVNAIDAHHFNTVHNFPVKIVFDKQEYQNAITFANTTRGGENSLFLKLIRPFYKDAVTYNMCYWYGSTGVVTVGPDFLHFHIMFTLRLLEGGKTEGQTILITKKRAGILGWIFNRIVLTLTNIVGNYFAKGDTKIFQTIKFDLKTPTKADNSIIQFIHHAEKQKPLAWKTWE